jgi:hypothetical protein
MTLAAKLAFQFDKNTQFLGRRAFELGLVTVEGSGPRHLRANVTERAEFKVNLAYSDDSLSVDCRCAYFQTHGQCQHIWAAVLEADRRGALAEALESRWLSLEDRLDDVEEDEFEELTASTHPSARAPFRPPPQIPVWQEQLSVIERDLERKPRPQNWPHAFEILYVIDIASSRSAGTIVVDFYSRSKKKSGEWTDYKPLRLAIAQAGALPDPLDAEIVSSIFGGQEYYGFGYSTAANTVRRALPPALAMKLLPMMSGAGRLALREDTVQSAFVPASWDGGEVWKFSLEVRQDDRDQWKITGVLRRGEECMKLEEPSLVLENGLLVARRKVARLDSGGVFPWIAELRSVKSIPFPDRDRDKVLARVLGSPVVPPMEVDAGLQFERREVQPRLGLRITQKREVWGEESFRAHLLFDYGRGWSDAGSGGRGSWHPEERLYLVGDAAAESAAKETLRTLGLRPTEDSSGTWRLSAKALPRIARELLRDGWHVEAEGKAFRRPGAAHVEVRSGIDWFELHAEVDYGGASATLPQLLAALRRGDNMVRLGDGTFGLLPEEWLERFGPLAGLGAGEEDHLRFQRNQAGLLDALLTAQPEVQVDEVFSRARERLRTFQGVKAAPQPEGFVGQLRDYQREGLGWMEFLREFGFGGCLADDMGVGKTAQVLALLETRRMEGEGPSLVVAPKSLMFNWREEAARFTPNLRVLEHTGTARDMAQIPEHNLVLTTYGTMLRDAAALAEIEFDYVVLDEAQAVKNATTASAKAVRLLRGAHRLALSGTPVENHLGELWSLFEFLNPGMLGEAKVLKLSGGLARNPGEEARRLLSQALRPFILRRTKQQVARELPEKTEQTIFCELEGAQRKQYDDLRAHYRSTLLHQVKMQGLAKAKIHVLEALLRLRQAACHPGLVDTKLASQPSAKLDVLLEQLEEVREEGHKALVFSQFTSLLSILRRRLDEKFVPYEYLDGSTRDRQARVEKFQNDENCGLFLISLKAGGLGLNLTAAEYVFLLDPWWNPAVETQAIDRAHRIGQTRQVFAYRLIARDTVEEKVLQLQNSKRELADAILNADNSLIRDLSGEDLELLLS